MVIDSVFGPWCPDRPDLLNGGVTVAHNVTPSIGNAQGGVTYSPLKRGSLYSETPLPSRPLGAAVGQDKIGTARVYCGTASGLYKIKLDKTWQDISRAGGYTTASSERWNFTEYANLQVGCNYTDPLQYIDMNTDIQWGNLTTLVRARRITTIKNFVVVGNTYDALDGDVPFRIRWSAMENPFDWNFSLQTQSDFQDIIGGGAVQAVVGGEAGTILLQRSIWKMTYTGGATIFQFDEVVKGKGCSIPESVITVDGKTYFVSDDGFYVYDGNGLTPIGMGQVDKHFLASVDIGQTQFMTVAADPREKLIYWSYVSNDGLDGTPDKMLIFNYQTGVWSSADATCAFIFNSMSLPSSIEDLDVFGTIEDVPVSFDSPLWAGGVAMLWGMDTLCNVYVFGGENLPATIETQEQYLIQSLGDVRGERTSVLGVRPMFHGGGGTAQVTVGSRSLSNADVAWTPLIGIHPETGWAYCRVQNRYHRFRVTLTGDWAQAMSLQIDASPAGSR